MKCDTRLISMIRSTETMRMDGKTDLNIPITISNSGLLVHGTIITQQEYYERHDGYISMFGEVVEEGEQEALIKSDATFSDLSQSQPEILHLNVSSIISGGSNILGNGNHILYRCLVDRIDGYFFGDMTHN